MYVCAVCMYVFGCFVCVCYGFSKMDDVLRVKLSADERKNRTIDRTIEI